LAAILKFGAHRSPFLGYWIAAKTAQSVTRPDRMV